MSDKILILEDDGSTIAKSSDDIIPSVYNIEYIEGSIVLSSQDGVIVNSNNDCNIFLPKGINHKQYTIKNIGNGNVTIITDGTDFIEGLFNFILFKGNSIVLFFLNDNWNIL